MTDYSTAAVDKSGVLRGLVSTARVPLGSEVYNRLLETLYDEAAALDERRFDDWVAMLHEELEIGRAHVRTPVTNAHLVCRLLLEKQKTSRLQLYITCEVICYTVAISLVINTS